MQFFCVLCVHASEFTDRGHSTHTHTHTHTHRYIHTHTHPRKLSLSHTLSHTHIHTFHAHTHTHRTHTHTPHTHTHTHRSTHMHILACLESTLMTNVLSGLTMSVSKCVLWSENSSACATATLFACTCQQVQNNSLTPVNTPTLFACTCQQATHHVKNGVDDTCQHHIFDAKGRGCKPINDVRTTPTRTRRCVRAPSPVGRGNHAYGELNCALDFDPLEWGCSVRLLFVSSQTDRHPSRTKAKPL